MRFNAKRYKRQINVVHFAKQKHVQVETRKNAIEERVCGIFALEDFASKILFTRLAPPRSDNISLSCIPLMFPMYCAAISPQLPVNSNYPDINIKKIEYLCLTNKKQRGKI